MNKRREDEQKMMNLLEILYYVWKNKEEKKNKVSADELGPHIER